MEKLNKKFLGTFQLADETYFGICEKAFGPGEARTHNPQFTASMPRQKSNRA